MTMRRQLLSLVFVTLTVATPTAGSLAKADVVFLLDKSGRVGAGNFQKMLDFVKGVIERLEVGPCDVQVGVDTFSTSFNTEFRLTTFNNNHFLSVALQRIKYTGGYSNTGPAITSLMGTSFTTYHREGVPKIAIVVTDGQSTRRSATVAAARTARAAGIHMLVVGVGSGVNNPLATHELNAIASDPDSQNVFKATTFDELTYLKSPLAARACQQAQQQHPQQTTCVTKSDIVFMLDSSRFVDLSNFKRMLSFVNSLTKDWDVSLYNIRVGLMIFSSHPYPMFRLNTHATKTDILSAINSTPYMPGSTNTGDALEYLRTGMFIGGYGDRPSVPDIGIIITNGRSDHPGNTEVQAEAARKAGISLFAIGVGAGVSEPELNFIAPGHVLTVENFSQLSAIKEVFHKQMCKDA